MRMFMLFLQIFVLNYHTIRVLSLLLWHIICIMIKQFNGMIYSSISLGFPEVNCNLYIMQNCFEYLMKNISEKNLLTIDFFP